MIEQACMNCAEAEECGTVARYAKEKPFSFVRIMASTEIKCKDFKEESNDKV